MSSQTSPLTAPPLPGLVSVAPSYKVKAGKILVFHLFDLADEIDLETLRQNWMGEATLIKLVSRRAAPYYMQFATSPLLLPLGRKSLKLSEIREIDAEVTIKIFEFGVASVCWELPFPTEWSQIVPDAPTYLDNNIIEAQSSDILDSIYHVLQPTLKKPYTQTSNGPVMEDYTVFYVQHFETPEHPLAETLIRDLGPDIASMVRGETKVLSPAEQNQILSQRISYFDDDLVVAAWNSAFIYDPEGSSEHVDILEFANSELLELRAYDDLMDRELEEIYDNVEKKQPGVWLNIWKNPYEDTNKRLLTLLLDVTELTDKIENSLKIIGDLYSARVYRMIGNSLQLKEWHARIDGKLASSQQIYAALNNEVHARRSTLLEIVIILLIAFEIVLAFAPLPFLKGH